MPVKLTTTITNISSVPNPTNQILLHEFHQYMKSIGTSDSYQNGNLKIMIYFAKGLVPHIYMKLVKSSKYLFS
jgi:integrase/recombinase XerD